MRQAARRLLLSLLAIARTRWDIVVLELQAERRRLIRLWLLASLTLWLMFTALWLSVVAALLWVEPAQRVGLATALAAGFALVGAAVACLWMRLALKDPRPRRSSP